MTATVMPHSKAAAASARAGSAVAATAISPAPSRTCSTTCSAISWAGAVGPPRDAPAPRGAMTCATTCASRWKRLSQASRKPSTSPPLWAVHPVREPEQKVGQNHRPAPPVPAWARSGHNKVFSRSNAPAPPATAWVRRSRTPARSATVQAGWKRNVPCRSTSPQASKPARGSGWVARARPECAADPPAICTSLSRSRNTPCSNARRTTCSAAYPSQWPMRRWAGISKCPQLMAAKAG